MNWLKTFPLCLILCLGGGWLTGWSSQSSIRNWYPNLIKPVGTPTDFIFPIVWTVLYVLMAIALGLLWISDSTNKRKAAVYFFIQLGLNFLWSWLFFYFHQIGMALIDILLLWIMILLTIQTFWKHTRLGSWLLLPYLVWVSYAFYLNLMIWILNNF